MHVPLCTHVARIHRISADQSETGDLTTQTFVGVVALGTLITFSLAIYNIRHLQLDQHRAWMLRSWFYCGFIIPLRIIQGIIAAVVTRWPAATRHALMTCPQLLYMYANNAATLHAAYPICAPENASLLEAADGFVPIRAALGKDQAQNSAALEVSFTAGGALALLLNGVGVEIYLWATKAEARRLRQVSTQMQASRGITPSRFADKTEEDKQGGQIGGDEELNRRKDDLQDGKEADNVEIV
jgi:hypothetical protein